MKNPFVAFLLIVAISAITVTTFASDRKVYPGAYCVETTAYTGEAIIYGTGGHAYNSSSSAKTWLCPVVRDNYSDDDKVSDWDVTVYRGSSTQGWDIVLYECNTYGTSCDASPITVPASPGNYTLDGASSSYDYDDGSLYIRTLVPSGCNIYSYAVSEE